jgi:addiction module HigA family antidote
LWTILEEEIMAGIAIHPGEHLAEELNELGMSAAELGRRLKVPTNRITGILNGQRAITGDTALRLAHFFGTSAEFWLNLESLYELRIAKKKAGKAINSLPTLMLASGREVRLSLPLTPEMICGRNTISQAVCAGSTI